MNKVRMIAATLAAGVMLSGCATGPNRSADDPLEPMNRVVFTVNDTIDTNIAVPIAKGYQKVTPSPIRTAISNFFSNIADLGNIANNLLQLRITDATQDVMRMAMNSLFGVAGLFDIATPAGLPKHHQDFGLTLARWGVPSGPYLVLPIFGPSSFRDGVGRAVDVRFNLLNYIEPAARNPMYIVQFVSARSDLLGATDLLQQAALDKYSFVRDAYMQQRKSLTYKGEEAPSTLPNYGDPGDVDGAPGQENAPTVPGAPKNEDPGAGAPGASMPAGASGVAVPASGGASAVPGVPASETPSAAVPAAASATDAAPAMPASSPAAN
ncbi:VacJ family lipoprotein [Burkholderia sp. lig30]|uniref:MlaA family lipoprotein n=1 Tax=Burkholderia sp. lig30 TaxID=1192124 RepID=UPI000461A70E|nr:VacJ family lipoprotein [Burkholderia sp. lig30]KDB06378.1 VacJ family lipoprotein [Burkholderia sp. lig30]